MTALLVRLDDELHIGAEALTVACTVAQLLDAFGFRPGPGQRIVLHVAPGAVYRTWR